MAVVRNVNEEHQLLFAINTISMVKSNSTFSYIALTNIIDWTLTPLRTCLTLHQFVHLNRMIIRVTHSLILLAIYAYECVVFRNATFQPIQLVEQHRPSGVKGLAFPAPEASLDLVSATPRRLREPSVAATRKDRALEEVFRTPFRASTLRDPPRTPIREATSFADSDRMATGTLLSLGGLHNNSNALVAKAEQTTAGIATGGEEHQSMVRMLTRMEALEGSLEEALFELRAWRGEGPPGMMHSYSP